MKLEIVERGELESMAKITGSTSQEIFVLGQLFSKLNKYELSSKVKVENDICELSLTKKDLLSFVIRSV